MSVPALATTVRVLWCLLVFTAQAATQTHHEVREAVEQCIGLETENVAARERLAAWGDAALPALEQLSVGASGAVSWHVLGSALEAVGTPAAWDRMLELSMSGERAARSALFQTLCWRSDAWDPEQPSPRYARYREHLLDVATAADAYHGHRTQALETLSWLPWRADVERLSPLLEDANVRVRRAAAAALFRLTGESPEIADVTPSFTRSGEGGHAELAGRLRAADARGLSHGFVRPSADGRRPGVLVTLDARLDDHELADSLRPLRLGQPLGRALDMPLWTRDVHTDELLVLGLLDLTIGARRGVLACVDERGRVRWIAPGCDLALALLHDRDGNPAGVLSREPGCPDLVALDLDGQRLWSDAGLQPVHRAASHPQARSLLALAGGVVRTLDLTNPSNPVRAQTPLSALVSAEREAGGLYVSGLACLPREDSGVDLIVTGSRRDTSLDHIQRRTLDGAIVWDVELASDVHGLAVLEPRWSDPLVAITTTDGLVSVLDTDGGLLWQDDAAQRLPDPRSRNDEHMLGLQAGVLDGDAWFSVSGRREALLYRWTDDG